MRRRRLLDTTRVTDLKKRMAAFSFCRLCFSEQCSIWKCGCDDKSAGPHLFSSPELLFDLSWRPPAAPCFHSRND